MQKAVRFNENQLLYLANKSRQENTIAGFLYKKSSDTGKWQLRYFILYQNLLLYFENDQSARPSGVALLEGSYCDRVLTPAAVKGKDTEKQYCFTITYKNEGQRHYDLRTDTEAECNAWIDNIKRAPYSKVLEQKEELEQKHLHLLQILDSERQSKWQYVQQTEELGQEVKKIRTELQKFKKERIISNHSVDAEETDELKKIKKVQSFFRGWLCRRRWKQIVELYIRSPHAESMRKRNSIVFNMVECEEEYNRQLSTLVTCFLRPLRMAASSKKPPISHEDVNSIFLNSETLLFLHQIFLKGLCARLENWPTLVLGDLFDMLLPMLCIYQEYVRNHHYSLQVLAEYKQKSEFNALLKRYEEKPMCEGRSVEVFLTYPMHQIPRYIITLHELLAHTPHDHVERQSLEYAKGKLEELSRIMHDEVSETENIRKNLSIERMIVEGCDILLDVNQTFVRQGPLLQILQEKGKSSRGRLGSISSSFKDSKKEVVRQVFLFTNHMLLTTRASNGRLHLAKHYGKIPLIDCTLIEDPSSDVYYFDDDTISWESFGSLSSSTTVLTTQACERDRNNYNGLDFKIIIDSKSGPPTTLTLVASTHQEKIAWCSDISQCIENLHYSDLLNSSMSESSSVTMPQSVRSDPKLFKDDVDIKFSRTLNSCKVPQIRHASVDRLLDRLTDLRFLSIDFLNTFLLTYRVFSSGKVVLEALKRVYKNPEQTLDSSLSSCQSASETDIYSTSPPQQFTEHPPTDTKLLLKPHVDKPRRISTGDMKHEVSTEKLPIERPPVLGSVTFQKYSRDSIDSDETGNELQSYLAPPKQKLAPIASTETLTDHDHDACVPSIQMGDSSSLKLSLESGELGETCEYSSDEEKEFLHESHIFMSGSESTDTFHTARDQSSTTISSAASSDTLTPGTPRVSPFPSPRVSPRFHIRGQTNGIPRSLSPHDRRPLSPSRLPYHFSTDSHMLDALALSPTLSPSSPIRIIKPHPVSSPIRIPSPTARATSPLRSAPSPNRRPSSPTKRDLSPSNRRPSSPTRRDLSPLRRQSSPTRRDLSPAVRDRRPSTPPRLSPIKSPISSPKIHRAPSPIMYSMSSPNIMSHIKRPFCEHPQDSKTILLVPGKRGSAEAESIGSYNTPRSSIISVSTPRSSIISQIEGSPPQAKSGAVVTSSRRSQRRSSSTAALTAFAVATAGSVTYPGDPQPPQGQQQQVSTTTQQPSVTMPVSTQPQTQAPPPQPQTTPRTSRAFLQPTTGTGDSRLQMKRESVISTAATMRVLNIVKHWVSKFQQDFESDPELKAAVIDMLEEMVCNTSLLPTEHKAAASILRTINKESQELKKVDLEKLLTPPAISSKDTFDTLSALDIAEQLTYLDHKIFLSIRSEELLGQAWMKPSKSHKAPHVLLVSKRFNEVSRLVVSEIVSRQNLMDRVACIEKWAAIADICRCMHNYNGVLQICAAFVNSSVYRLKKTWEKLSKQTRQMIERLQNLVSSDGRFKNMRDALHRCDPPTIPYLGMYLTDLSFIEEGTPDYTEENLINFSKMRMIAHVIREIRLFQQTPYRIEHHPRVTNYLLDPARLLNDDQTYKYSLEIEPKQSRLSTVSLPPS